MVILLSACNTVKPIQVPVDKINIRIGALKGPTALGMLKLMEDAAAKTTKNNYTFTLAGAPDEISGKLISGELDMAAIPANLAAVLHNKTEGKIQMAAINTLGVLYLLDTGESIKSMQDLAGKTVYATGQGSTPEYALNYLLRANGLEPGVDVEVIYKSEHAEVATLMAEGKVEFALLPQPFVSTVLSKGTARVALDFTEEWQKVGEEGSNLVMGAFAVRKEFYEQNTQAVQDLLEEYESSIAYTNENVAEAAVLSGKYEIIAEPVAKTAIPECNIVYYSGEEMKVMTNAFLKVLFEADPKSVGGALPSVDFYVK
jgi:NitT/TauT family transport system substrate-binding protein